MKTQLKATRSRLFAFAAAAWMLFGTLLLVLMTMWKGWPFPAAVPQQPFALAGFVLTIAFVYVLPVWLLLVEHRYRKARSEASGFGALAIVAGSLTMLWTAILFS
jgi:hypothetical protein